MASKDIFDLVLEKNGDIFRRVLIEKKVEKTTLTPEQISELVISEITKTPPKIIQKTIRTEIIRPTETIKETKIKEDKDLRKEIETLKRELEAFKQILPLGGSGVIGLPTMAKHSGQFLTTDGNNPSWATVSSGSSTSNPVSIGDPTVNGSWRLFDDGTNLLVQRREGGVWIEKGAFLS